jgi:hypothetical protein
LDRARNGAGHIQSIAEACTCEVLPLFGLVVDCCAADVVIGVEERLGGEDRETSLLRCCQLDIRAARRGGSHSAEDAVVFALCQ